MSEQTPTNLSNADFTFKDKYGNTGKTKGVSNDDSTKLNNMVKLMNLMLNTPNSTDFINTLATKQYVDENQSSGLNLFDIVAKDHVLTYGKDLEGFAPLGTWVYKTAVDGTRYGYPDFVQKCLDEYAEATDDVIPYKKFEQPILSANGTLGGNSFAVQASSEYSSSYSAWKAFDNSSGSEDCWITSDSTSTGILTIYNPQPIRVKKIAITNRNNNTYTGAISSGTIYGSNDGSTWEEISTFTNNVLTYNTQWSIDLPSNTSFYKYHKLNVTKSSNTTGTYLAIGELKITAHESLAVKRHSNGHIFFDIADIDKVNALYNERKEAWLYGIDETNERVFLPRSTRIKFGSTSEVGEYQEEGVPNIKATFGADMLSRDPSPTNAITVSSSALGSFGGGGGPVYQKVYDFNASRSSSIYGNSDTVEYSSTKLIPYMVVGNVKVEQASTDVIDVTTTNNDTVPLFTAHYFDYTPNNPSWLVAGGQSNSGELYATCYNELVNVLNGETKYGSLKVIDEADMVSGEDYSLYWIVNQTTETFRTPTKTQQRFVVKTYQNGTEWYRIYNDGWCEQGGETIASNSAQTITLLKPYIDKYYSLVFGAKSNVSGWGPNASNVGEYITPSSSGHYSNNQFQYSGTVHISMNWQASGYIDLTNEQIDTSLYFKVANAVENIQMLDVGEITEALNLRADLSLANVNNNGKIAIAHNAMPSSVYDDLTLGATGSQYIAPADGIFYISKQGLSGHWVTLQNLTAHFDVRSVIFADNNAVAVYILAKKGDVIEVSYSASLTLYGFRFIYAVGSESEKA